MKRLLVFFSFIFCFSFVFSEVSVISVTDEDKHTKKEDFFHTFEYLIYPLNNTKTTNLVSVGKCQATRISRKWFATAAHCLSKCSSGCKIEVDLLEQPISAKATVIHSKKNPTVFIHPDYSSKVFVKNDFALIRLDLNRAPLTYYERPNKLHPYNLLLSEQQFNQFLEKNRKAASQFWHIKKASFPPLVFFDNWNYILDRDVSVISIFDGKREVKKNPYAVHYVKNLGFAYTQNFGIRQGMSGSGVMTNTGELLGMISGITWSLDNPMDVSKQLFVFPVFNKEIADFMEQTMGSDYYKLEWKDAYPYLVHKSRKNYQSIINRIPKEK